MKDAREPRWLPLRFPRIGRARRVEIAKSLYVLGLDDLAHEMLRDDLAARLKRGYNRCRAALVPPSQAIRQATADFKRAAGGDVR